MKTKTLSTLSILGIFALASQFANAATDIKFYGASSEATAYKWSSAGVTTPWENGVKPSTPGSVTAATENIVWSGMGAGQVDEGTGGYISHNSTGTIKIHSIAIGDEGKDIPVNIYLESSKMFYFLGIDNRGNGGKIKFYAKDGVAGGVTWWPTTGTNIMNLNTNKGNNPFILEVGKNTTFNISDTAIFKTDAIDNEGNEKPRGQIILSDGGKMVATEGKRVRFNDKGGEKYFIDEAPTHRDLIIGKGSAFTALGNSGGVEFTNGIGISVNGTFQVANTIVSGVTAVDLGAGDDVVLDFGKVTFGGNGDTGDISIIKIYDFRDDVIAVSSITGAKYDKTDSKICLNFERWDEAANEWKHDIYLNSETGKLFATGLAVPEPAEWAAIFGGIALALAVYRRRK